ncbi:MAG: hypothetical protein RBS86_04960 [Candidatus Moranbacteria bacterium]|jgi:hypothetical protein|nr:hypothetical protein [Candidatus Moranbacteria bacterium]
MNRKNIFKFIKENKALIAFFVAVLIIILRRPDAVMNAQFWAEDGTVWFSKAYNEGGLKSLLQPQNGYYQTISKLVAWISLAFPLKFAPFIFNSIAIIIKALPVALVWSSRFSKIIPSDAGKLAISAAYLLLPTIAEVHSNITNAHWHLAVYAFMIIVSISPKSFLGKLHDIFFVIIAGLSGPFSIILSPIVIIFWWFRRKFLSGFFYAIAFAILLCAGIQVLSVLLTSEGTRSQAPLGASVGLFIGLISGKLFGVLLFGAKYIDDIAESLMLSLPIFLIGMGIIIFALFRASLELKLFIIFSALLITAAFNSPMISNTSPQWPSMISKTAGSRYFFIPLVAWSASLIWFLSRIKNKKIKIALSLIVGLLVSNVFLTSFKISRYKDKEFYNHVEIFSNLPSGSEYRIPINPGKGWDVFLIKK